MKHYHRTVISAAVVALMAGAALPAQATPSVGTANTKTATLDFSNPSGVTHTLTVVPGVGPSAANNTVLANGVIKATDSSSQRFGVRWTPTATNITIDSSHWGATIKGESDATHQLYVNVNLGPAESHWNDTVQYWIQDTAGTEATYTVKKHNGVTTPADTYVLSLDAAIYTA